MKNKLPRLIFFSVLTVLFVWQVTIYLPVIREQIQRRAGNRAPNAPVAPASLQPPASSVQAALRPRPKSVGDELLTRAAAQLENRVSVAARLRHQATIPGRQMIYGIGSYWQQGTADELRVRLELQIAGQEASVLQVSDSRFLWLERRLPVGRTVTRVDLRQLRADALVGGAQLAELQPGNANWTSMQGELVAHSGGLPSLLSSLSERFTFLPPQPMRIASEEEPGKETTSIPFFAVVGHWRPDQLAKLLPANVDGQAAPPDAMTAKVPVRLPQEVLILFGQADLFPYRIEYRKLETPIAANQAGAAIPYQLSANPMVVLEFTDVRFDVPTDTDQFIYSPGDSEWTDQTTAVLERLRQFRDAQLAGRGLAPLK